MRVAVRGTTFVVQDDGFAAFWARVSGGGWEPDSFGLLDALVEPGAVLVDVGAWIGPLTLYAAARGARCHSLEPDPLARKTLCANVALNPDLAGRVQVDPVAVAETTGTVRMGSITSDVGGDSMSSLLFADGKASWDVETVRLEELLTERVGVKPALVKIDIEGAEVEVLGGSAEYLARARPPLHLSVHARFWSDPMPRMTRLLEVLSCYPRLFTPALVPVEPETLLQPDSLGGIFEIVAFP